MDKDTMKLEDAMRLLCDRLGPDVAQEVAKAIRADVLARVAQQLDWLRRENLADYWAQVSISSWM